MKNKTLQLDSKENGIVEGKRRNAPETGESKKNYSRLYSLIIPRQSLFVIYPYVITDEIVWGTGHKPEPSIRSLDENLAKHWTKDAPLPPSVIGRLEKNDYKEQNSVDGGRSYDPFYDKRDEYRMPSIIRYCRAILDWTNYEEIIRFCNFYGTFEDIRGIVVQKDPDIFGTSIYPGGQYVNRFVDTMKQIKTLARALLSPSHEEHLTISEEGLHFLLNEFLHGSEFQISGGNGTSIPMPVYNNLRQAIGIYFSAALLNKNGMWICKACQGVIERKDPRQQFCSRAPDDGDAVISKCKMRWDKRENRKNKGKGSEKRRAK